MLAFLAAGMLMAQSPTVPAKDIQAAADRCGIKQGDLRWELISATQVALSDISPTMADEALRCFGKWLDAHGVQIGFLGREQ